MSAAGAAEHPPCVLLRNCTIVQAGGAGIVADVDVHAAQHVLVQGKRIVFVGDAHDALPSDLLASLTASRPPVVSPPPCRAPSLHAHATVTAPVGVPHLHGASPVHPSPPSLPPLPMRPSLWPSSSGFPDRRVPRLLSRPAPAASAAPPSLSRLRRTRACQRCSPSGCASHALSLLPPMHASPPSALSTHGRRSTWRGATSSLGCATRTCTSQQQLPQIHPSPPSPKRLCLPPPCQEIDLAGRFLLPGLCDAHVHVTAAASADLHALAALPVSLVACRAARGLQAMLMRGFTTVRDAGGCDQGLARELRRGARQIKVMASGDVSSPSDRVESVQFSEGEMRAAVEEAEAQGTHVMAHAYTARAIKRAVACGVRSIEHGNMLDEEAANLMLQKGSFLVPTLVTYERIKQAGQQSGMDANIVAKVRC
ncbi:unnamed protein product [Closterium sp. Naga37s-1]|nr:unnamed protein product [Closterium sp. Naga37s-1]